MALGHFLMARRIGVRVLTFSEFGRRVGVHQAAHRGAAVADGGMRDVALGLVPQGLAAITGFVGSVLIARGLGPARLGEYALVMSVAGLATSLADLGVGQTAIRFAARAASDQGRPAVESKELCHRLHE